MWNFLVGAVYVLSVGPAAYGAGNVASGQASLDGVGSLIAGVAIGTGARCCSPCGTTAGAVPKEFGCQDH
jgi:hypothetical protein